MLNNNIFSEFDNGLIYYEELQDALLGFTERYDLPPILVYDYNKCITILMNNYNYTKREAKDYFDYNIENCSPGEHTPIFVKPLKE